MRFIAIPTRNLARRPARTLLTILGIVVAVSSLVALVGLANGFANAWLSSLTERNTHLVGTQKGVVEILTSTLPEAALTRLRGIEGVAGAHGSLLGLVVVLLIVILISVVRICVVRCDRFRRCLRACISGRRGVEFAQGKRRPDRLVAFGDVALQILG